MNIHDMDLIRETKKITREESHEEDAVLVVRKYHQPAEVVAADFDVPLKRLKELLEKK